MKTEHKIKNENDSFIVEEALSYDDSCQSKRAMTHELYLIDELAVWKPALLSPENKLVTTKWLSEKKATIGENVVRYSATIVAKGFILEKHGFGHDICTSSEVHYSPVSSSAKDSCKTKYCANWCQKCISECIIT